MNEKVKSDNTIEPAAVKDKGVIHVVDDDRPFQVAVGRLLRSLDYEVVDYSSAEQVLAEAEKLTGCILLDVRMEGMSGLELQSELAKHGNPLPIVFVTAHGSIAMGVHAIKAGAEDFLTKPIAVDTLVPAIDRALRRGRSAAMEHKVRQEQLRRFDLLTKREREVFLHLAKGRLNKQIAFDLETSERTIQAHRGRIMEKLELRSMTELARYADELQVKA